MLKKMLIAVAAVVFLLTSAVNAQVVQTGNIMGIVTTQDGSPIPGVSVTLKSPAIVIGQLSAVTNEKGQYRFMALLPGEYELTLEMEGFQRVVRKNIRVVVGSTVTMNFVMQFKTLEEEVVVQAAAPTIDKQKVTKPVNLDKKFIASIPAARDLGTYFNMVPGVTGGTAHGSSTMDNTFNMDGINMVDPATGTRNVNFGMDIMEELSVQKGGLSAEYGSVRGAVINVVTKSGGNNLSGQAQIFYNHEDFKSDNTKGTPFEGSKSGAKYEIEPSLSIGGPIIKNKLWFFTSASFNLSESFIAGYPWGSKAGEEIPIRITLPYPFLKLTFQPNPDDRLSLTYNYSDRLNNHRFADLYSDESVTVKQITPTHVFSLQWTKFFNPNFYMNFRAGAVLFKMNLDAKGDQPEFYDVFATPVARYYGNYWRNQDHYTRNRIQTNIDATYFVNDLAGTHEFKGGLEAQLGLTSWKIYGVGDWKSTDGKKVGAYYIMYGSAYNRVLVLVNNGFDRKDNMVNLHGFIQDTWTVNKHLTFNLGLRVEYNSVIYPKQNVEEGPITFMGRTYDRSIPETMKMFEWVDFAPRAGLVFDILGDGKNLIKASFSRYILPNQIGWVNLAHPNGWFGYWQFLNPDGSIMYSGGQPRITWWAVPGGFKNNGAVVGYTSADGKEYKLKAGYTDEVTLGFEKELAPDWSFSATYIKKWDRNQPFLVDAAQLDMDKLMATGELDWSKNWTPVVCIDPYSRKEIIIWQKKNLTAQKLHIVNPPGADRNYDGIEVTLRKRFSNKYSLDISYVWSYSRGLISTDRDSESLGTSGLFSNPNSQTFALGRLPLERRHQLKINGLVQLPFGINLSGYFRAMSGTRATRLINTSFNNVLRKDTGTPFRPVQGDETIYAEPRGSTGLPDLWLLDLRLEKEFNFGRIKVVPFADCFNISNEMLITGYSMTSNNPNTPYLRQTGINDPRIFRLGARIEF